MYRNRIDYLTLETIDGKYRVTIKRDYLLGRQYEVSKARAQQLIRLLDNPNVMCRPYLFSGMSITIGYRPKPAKYAMLVYQGGLANLFLVDLPRLNDYDRNAKRLYQGDFHGAVCFARGLGTAGYIVRTAGCNQAGDITKSSWSAVLSDLPFSDRLVNVHMN